MIQNFLLEYAKLISSDPSSVSVTQNQINDDTYELKIFAKQNDIGRLIGKEGKVINALKAFITGCKAKDDKIYKITVKNIDEKE